MGGSRGDRQDYAGGTKSGSVISQCPMFPRWERRERGQTVRTLNISGDDAALIERARRARNGEKFSTLWQGDYWCVS